MIRYFFFLPLIASIASCKKIEKDPINKFADTVITKIADFQDRRLGDSLTRYLKNSNASYRREAALAYASVQDSSYSESIGALLLQDKDSSVRRAAAFALGQTPSVRSENLLYEGCQREANKFVLAEAIEAYGKVSKTWKVSITSADSIVTNALAWSYYRMGVRGLSDAALNSKAAELLKPTCSQSTRLGAAHFFARGATRFNQHQAILIQSAKQDVSPEVRMAAALALRKIETDSAKNGALSIAVSDLDYRVRINALRALQVFPFAQTKAILMRALQDSAASVGIAASEIIKASITKESWKELNTITRSLTNWRIQANLYEAALSVSDHKELAEEIRAVYKTSSNVYQKAALLTALQHSIMSYGFVQEQLFKNKEPVIKLSAADALVAMNYRKNFDASLKPRFAKLYEAAIKDGDVAVIGTIAGALADSTLNYKTTILDFSFLREARSKLTLPKDFEGVVPLEMAIAYFEGKKLNTSLSNKFNHPIPWHEVKKIPRDQKAIIKTTQGDIIIQLLIEEAPGSVINFVTLAKNKYYDNKFIHRVVPNFVVQAGCPRGDGWGSEDYSIRSEFSMRRYTTGSVGMASAGKDTEGTQWFITHSPTPHLDGRYTLFAEVKDGMDVGDKIAVGDKIISVEIIGAKSL